MAPATHHTPDASSPRPLAWLGISLATGLSLLMLYVPYEFQAPPHRFVYPYLTWFGFAFGLSGLLTAAGLVWVGFPRWVEGTGRLLITATLAIWGWGVAVLPGAVTGMIAYGLLVAVFLTSALAPRFERVLHKVLYATLPTALGIVMLGWPRLFPFAIYGNLGAALGIAMCGAGLVQVATLALTGNRWSRSWSEVLAAPTLMITALPLAWFAWQWAQVSNWLGVCMYGLLSAGALLPPVLHLLPRGLSVTGLRRRILAVAVLLSVVPLFGLGAVAVQAIQTLDRAETLGSLRMIVLMAEREVVDLGTIAQVSLRASDRISEQVRGNLNWQDLKVQVLPLLSLPARWPVEPWVSAFEDLDAAGQRTLLALVRRPDLGFAVAVYLPSHAAYAHARSVTATMLFGTMAIAALAVVVSLPLSHYLTGRLTTLRQVAGAVGARHFEARAAVLGASDDEVDYLAATINEMAATLGAYSQEIEDRNQQLRAQAAELAAASAGKDRFLAVFSHELRNPLSAIQAGVDVLHRQSVTAPVTHAAAIIGRNAQVLSRLAADLQDLSRAAAGKVVLQRLPMRLDEFVAGAVAQMQPRAQAKGLTMAMQPAPAVSVSADPERLEQVMSNLIGNAIKFTPPGGHISVTVAGAGESVRLSVVDSGIGLDTHEQAHLFDMFWQGQRAGEGQAGLGIGLALVKQLVELHGGRVSATSPGAGKGSTFSVELPALCAEPESSSVDDPSPPSASVGG